MLYKKSKKHFLDAEIENETIVTPTDNEIPPAEVDENPETIETAVEPIEVKPEVDPVPDPEPTPEVVEDVMPMTFYDDNVVLIKQIQTELTLLKLGTVGTEGFFNSAMRLLRGLANMVSRLFSTFKLVYRSFQGLKRTEIHSYQEKYPATIAAVKRLNFVEVSTVKLPRPKGLNVTFIDVTQKLITCLKTCDMVNRSRSFAATAKNLEDQLKAGATTGGTISALYGQSGEINQINNLYDIVSKCFVKGAEPTAEFSLLFRSMDEFSNEHKLLSDGSQYEYDVTKVYNNLETCNEALQKAVEHAEDRKHTLSISKEELVSLSEACVFIAKVFDTYGLAIQDFNRVEHNYVEDVKALVRKFKL